MSSPARKPSCMKQRSLEEKRNPSSPCAASGSIGGTSEMLPYAQANGESTEDPSDPRNLFSVLGSVFPPTPMLMNISVHFPTAKRELVKTRVTHSPTSYDRSPIVVAPNTCALPARGCPGRTYDPSANGRSIHPSAAPRRRSSTPCPGLVPDEGSSDDSDGLISPPPERTPPMFSDEDRALAFAAARSPKVRRPSREFRRPSYEDFSSPDEGCLGGF